MKSGIRPPGSIEPAAIRASVRVRPGNGVAGRDGAYSGDRRAGLRRLGAAGAGRRRALSAFRSYGFTLLETMVALVIFAGAAMALYALFNTNLIGLARAHDVSRQVPAVRYAIEHLASVNPREEGGGRFEMDGLNVAWSATLLQPPRQSQTSTGGIGFYEVGLYEIEFTMSERGRPLGTWRMRSVGFEKVREPEL